MLPYTNSDPVELEPIAIWRKWLAVLMNLIGAVVVLWCMYTFHTWSFASAKTNVTSELKLLRNFYECAQQYPDEVSDCIPFGQYPGFKTDSDSAFLVESTEGMQSFTVTEVWWAADSTETGREWLRVAVDVVREDDIERVVWIWSNGQGLTIEGAGVRER